MMKASEKLIAGAQEALAVASGEQRAASVFVGGHRYYPTPEWRPADECAMNAAVLLLIGESVPEVPDICVGTRISGDSAEELGYREMAKYGGWLIWNNGSDFYVIDIAEPRGWMPIPGWPPHP